MRAIILILAALVCISCSDATTTSLDTQAAPVTPVTPVEPDTPEVVINFVPDNNTPYATIEELEVLSSNPENVHYKVARVIVLQEVLSDEVNKYDKSFALSYTPVIIHGLDGKAQYYEYRLTKDGNAYRSYAVMVLKHQGVGVVTKKDLASDYSANKKGMKVVAPIYPSRYGLASTVSRSNIINQQFYIPGMDETVGLAELLDGTEIGAKLNEPSVRGVVDESLVDLLVADMDDPKFWSAMKTSSTQFSQMRNAEGEDNMTQQINESYNEKKQLNIEKFKSMDAEMQRVISLSQEEMEKELVEKMNTYEKSKSINTRWYNHQSVYASKVYNPYTNNYWKRIKNLYWDVPKYDSYWDRAWCGPTALAMIMQGYYHRRYGISLDYSGYFISFFRNATNENKSDWFPSMTYWEFKDFFRGYGHNIQFGNGFIWRNSIAQKAYNHIGSGSPILFHVPGHWVFAVQANYQQRTRGWWIFKWTETYRNFRMTDNGAWGNKHGDLTWWMGESNLYLIWMHPVELR